MTAQLPQVLVRNSFNILGLSSISALKEIRKRSQQLLQLAKIEEVQEFDSDIGHVKEFRTETEIRLALERVSGIQERLKEIFFWFESYSIESGTAISLLSKKDYKAAIDIFEKAVDTKIDFLGQKNLALALMFHAFAYSSLDSFYRSLGLWNVIADFNAFWEFYEKHYLLHDELGTSSSLFEEFRNSIYEILSAIAVSFYHQTKNPEAIGACYSAFGQIGKAVDIEILQPIILKIKKEVEGLEQIDPEAEIDVASIRRILKRIQKYFADLDKFELSDFSPLIVLKNDIGEKLRSISVSIYNQNYDHGMGRLFLDLSSKLAVSEAVLNKIETDKKQLQENETYSQSLNKWMEISPRLDEIRGLISNAKMEEAKNAYFQLDKELELDDDKASRIQLLINYCSFLIENGHELFGKKKFGIEVLAISGFLNRKSQLDALLMFEHAAEILKDRLYLLHFTHYDCSEFIGGIDFIANDLNKCELGSLYDRQQSHLKIVNEESEKQEKTETQAALNLLCAAVCHGILYRRFRGITQRKMWKWIGWTVAILLCFFVIMGNDKPVSKPSYKNSNYQTKLSYASSSQNLSSQEQEAIEWLDILYEDALKSLRDKGHSDRQIAQSILKKMKEAGYSDIADFLIDLEKKTS